MTITYKACVGSVLSRWVASWLCLNTMFGNVTPRRSIGLSMWVGLLVAGLGGCATAPPPELSRGEDDERRWELHRAQVEAVSSWRLVGKVSVRYEDQLWSAGMNWLHDQSNHSLHFFAPGGRTMARLRGSASGADARDAKGQTYRAETFEQLVTQVLGFEVPVSSLRYWVMGIPDPQRVVERLRLRRDGRAEELIQRGWRVSYPTYRPSETLSLQTLDLPQRMVLKSEDLQLTIIAQSWMLFRFSADTQAL